MERCSPETLGWLRERGTLPPMVMPEIMTGLSLPDDVSRAITALVEHKAKTAEGAPVDRIPLLDDWMDAAYERGRDYAETAPVRYTDKGELDRLFRDIVLSAPSPTPPDAKRERGRDGAGSVNEPSPARGGGGQGGGGSRRRRPS